MFSVSETEYKQLVGNIEELIESHQRLNSGLEDVRRCGPRHQRLGSVFLQVDLVTALQCAVLCCSTGRDCVVLISPTGATTRGPWWCSSSTGRLHTL